MSFGSWDSIRSGKKETDSLCGQLSIFQARTNLQYGLLRFYCKKKHVRSNNGIIFFKFSQNVFFHETCLWLIASSHISCFSNIINRTKPNPFIISTVTSETPDANTSSWASAEGDSCNLLIWNWQIHRKGRNETEHV